MSPTHGEEQRAQLFDTLFGEDGPDMGDVRRRGSTLPYEEQCVRQLIAAMGEDNQYVRTLFEARQEGRKLELTLVNELFNIQFGLVVGEPQAIGLKSVSVADVFKTRKKLPKLVELYYEVKPQVLRVAAMTAAFVRARDAGNIVIHDRAPMGNQVDRRKAARLVIGGKLDHMLVIERRSTFLRAVAHANFV